MTNVYHYHTRSSRSSDEWQRIKYTPGKHDDYFFHDNRKARKNARWGAFKQLVLGKTGGEYAHGQRDFEGP